MGFLRFKEDDESFLNGRSYTHAIRMALVSVLLGGGFLALAKFLRPKVAEFTESLGWFFLAFSTVVLFTEWREKKRLLSKHEKGRHYLHPHRPLSAKDWSLKLRTLAGEATENEDARREEAIDRLYAELRPLMSRAATDPSLREEAQRKLSRLRKLQDEEADEIQKRFEAGLLLKPGEGRQALERAREILARYEDPPSTYAATRQKD